MAKNRGSNSKFSGKLGDHVYVRKKKDKDYVRKSPRNMTPRMKAALKKHNRRTPYLNSLASEVNAIIRGYSDNFKGSDFYQTLNKRFRKEPLNKRGLLLLQLKDLDVNPKYPFQKLGACKADVSIEKNKIVVNVQATTHPSSPPRYTINCYYYEVVLITWNKGNDAALHSRQYSDWMEKKREEFSEFDFEFPKPKDMVHWLLCLRQRLGWNKTEIETMLGESMQIRAAGTLDEDDLEILKQRDLEKQEEEKKRVKQEKKDVVRVKAKGSKS